MSKTFRINNANAKMAAIAFNEENIEHAYYELGKLILSDPSSFKAREVDGNKFAEVTIVNHGEKP